MRAKTLVFIASVLIGIAALFIGFTYHGLFPSALDQEISGDELYFNNNPLKALECYQKALQKNPGTINEGDLRFKIAVIYHDYGHLIGDEKKAAKLAIKNYKRALELTEDPERIELIKHCLEQLSQIEPSTSHKGLDAEFIEDDFPVVLKCGQRKLVKIRIKNTGSEPWSEPEGVRLGSWKDRFIFFKRCTLSGGQTVQPGGGEAFLEMMINAPSKPGEYFTGMRMLKEGETWFGELRLIKRIRVKGEIEPPHPQRDLKVSPTSNHSRVMLVGLDGMTWYILTPMMKMGKCPNLDAMIRHGFANNYMSEQSMTSPALWTTMITGKSRQVHGITDFTVPGDQPFLKIPINSLIRRCKALWNILSEGGRSVGVINWWASYPAEKVNGFLISERKNISMNHLAYPETLEDDYAMLINSINDAWEKGNSLPEGLSFPDYETLVKLKDEILDVKIEGAETINAMVRDDILVYSAARRYWAEGLNDFSAYYLRSSDVCGHLLWRYFEPETIGLPIKMEPEMTQMFNSALPKIYSFLDNASGFAAEVACENTDILLVSDHGMRQYWLEGNYYHDLNRLFEALGLMVQDNWEDSIIYDSTRSGQVAYSRVLNINRTNLNTKETLSNIQYEQRLREISDLLLSIRTTDGRPLFESISIEHNRFKDTDDRFPPAIRVNINPNLPHDGMLHLPNGGNLPVNEVVAPPHISGNHDMKGIIIGCGADFRVTGSSEYPDIYDLAPTILYLLGMPLPEDFPGRVMLEYIDKGFKDSHPIDTIPTYEDGSIVPVSQLSPHPSDKEVLEGLRALGYIQ